MSARLLGEILDRVVRAQDAVTEAENIAIDGRSSPLGFDDWELTSLKLDLDRLRGKLARLWEETRAAEEEAPRA